MSCKYEKYPSGSTVYFPYQPPYRQQVDLMEVILSSLRNGCKVMLLESPTGTGKSLSLACSTLAWLRHKEHIDLLSEVKSINMEQSTEATNWIDDFVPQEERERQQQLVLMQKHAHSSRNSLQKHLAFVRQKVRSGNRERRENLVRSAVTSAKMRERSNRRNLKKRKKHKFTKKNEEDFCIEDYTSDPEEKIDYWNSSDEESESFKDLEISNLFDGASLDGSSATYSREALGGVSPGSGVRKIIYAARTHSQLSQFVGELKRAMEDVRVVALGGRKILCGNKSEVNRPGLSEQTINDACLDLQKSKTSSCALLSSKEGVAMLALHGLAQPSDIEDTAALGEASHTCAYYASRTSISAAEVVVLPYSMLLSPSSRKSVGLRLKESLVIIDEAHNLPEAIRSLQSCSLSLPVVQACLEQLTAYTKRYENRLAGRNLYYLGQLRRCLKAFISRLQQQEQKSSKLITAGELLLELKLENINLFKIISYLNQSKLPQKLLGFTNASSNDEENEGSGTSKHISSLSTVQDFLCRLTCTSKEGKFLVEWPKVEVSAMSTYTRHPTLRFVALHPAHYFENVVKEAHAVALVGGTMQPFSHIVAELLENKYFKHAMEADAQIQANCDAKKISLAYTSPLFTAFTCDHVIPSCNVLLECLSTGPSGTIKLDFRHQHRLKNTVIDELGNTILQSSIRVPAGMVIFFPSYSYEAQVVRRWKVCGIWRTLNRQKRVYREPKRSMDVEETLEAYSKHSRLGGAILLSVVGGKMSEGINFANDMARCVAVVGLPYPDITDLVLREKMMTMDQTPGSISGRAYYHNLCLRAVNQSIGRAIRHAKDYASILLIDYRYTNESRIRQSLPRWLRNNNPRSHNMSFFGSMNRIDDFFRKHKPG